MWVVIIDTCAFLLIWTTVVITIDWLCWRVWQQSERMLIHFELRGERRKGQRRAHQRPIVQRVVRFEPVAALKRHIALRLHLDVDVGPDWADFVLQLIRV